MENTDIKNARRVAVSHTREQKNTLFVVVLTSLMNTFNASSLNLSIPSIGAEFGASAQLVGWIVTIYALFNVAFALPFGKLADVTDKIKIFRAGVLIFALSIGMCAMSWDIWSMIASRLVQGLGASMIFATNMAILIDAFEPRERGRVLGLSVSATYIGLAIGPVVGGVINNYLGWRYIMVISGIASCVVVACAFMRLKPVSHGKVSLRGFDLKGSVLFIFAMTLLMYGLTMVGSTWLCWPMMVIGAVLSVLFVRCESGLDDPMLKVSLFRNKGFSYSSLAAFMNYGATFAVSYYLSIYLQVVKGCPSQLAGLILITSPVVQAALSPFTGKLSDKHSPYKLSSAGMGACAVALLLLCTVKVSTDIRLIVPMLSTMGVGFAFFSSPNTNAIMSSVSSEDRGIASSIVATVRNAGATAAMAIITIIVGINMGSLSMSEAPIELVVQTMHISFMIFSVLCFGGIFISLKRK